MAKHLLELTIPAASVTVDLVDFPLLINLINMML